MCKSLINGKGIHNVLFVVPSETLAYLLLHKHKDKGSVWMWLVIGDVLFLKISLPGTPSLRHFFRAHFVPSYPQHKPLLALTAACPVYILTSVVLSFSGPFFTILSRTPRWDSSSNKFLLCHLKFKRCSLPLTKVWTVFKVLQEFLLWLSGKEPD